MIFLAGFLGGAARRYTQTMLEERQEEKDKAALAEKRTYETKRARQDALLGAEKDSCRI